MSVHAASRIGWAAAALLSIGMAGYALAYLVLREAVFPDVVAESFRARPGAIYSHVLFGAPAIAIAPFQFLRGSFAKRPKLHRVLGRIYFIGALGTGASGIFMSFYAFGGLISGAGFFAMAAANLLCAGMGFVAIRSGDVAVHRTWMLRSAAMTFSAVTFRAWLALLAATLGDFRSAYAAAAWASWVVNLLFAEWLLRRLGWIRDGRPALAAPLGVA